MKPERWKQVDELLEAALDRPPTERASFLDRACAGDEALRRELESLLISDAEAETFIEAPPARVAADFFSENLPQPVKGDRISHYEILAHIGSGGMGEVYLARDIRLGRKVALKLLPPSLTSDGHLKARFFREAQLASTLDHPNVCTIHEVGQSARSLFIAMQYVEGFTLKQIIGSRPLKLDALLSISLQVADALVAAHEQGIIHRDIKSNNIIISARGQAKVLDFGLAKFMDASGVKHDNRGSNPASELTRTGVVLGTPNYMSPEQARGERVDHRSDIFSLGVVIYEMASGDVPFKRKSQPEILSAVINDRQTPVMELNEDIPAGLSATIDRALSKDPADRYQSMGEMLRDLQQVGRAVGLLGSSDSQGAVIPYVPLGRRSRWMWTMALLALVLLVGLGVWFLSLRSVPHSTRAPMQTTPLTSYLGTEILPAFSPDGKQVAFTWDGEKSNNFDIYVKQVDTGTPHRLTTNPADDSFATWSPDGSHIAFRRHTQESDAVYIIPSLSGQERRLADIFPRLLGYMVGGDGLRYSSDGKFLAVPDKSSSGEPFSIVLISTETGEKRKLTSPPIGSVGDNTPVFSPDGGHLAFSRISGQGVEDIYVMPTLGGEPMRLTFDNRYIRDLEWTADGREIVFISLREGDAGLWRVSASGGTPERVVTAVGYTINRLSIARQGDRMVYSQQFLDTNIWRVELGPQRKVSAPTMLISSSKSDSAPQYSPEGKRITFRSDRSGSFEIWACDADGSNPVQLTNFGGPLAGSPCWSPDGKQIAFDARPDGNPDIFVISVDGGRPRRLTEHAAEDIAPGWSRDGRWIYFESNRSGSAQIWKMPADGGEARQVTKNGGSVAYESMDGKFLYYTKDRSVAGIWRVPVDGGEETLVLDLHKAGYWRAWTVVEQGIYFLTAEKPARPAIEFFSFATGRVTEVAALEKPFRPWTNPEGLSISPDGRWVLYTQEDRADIDIMLVENFR